MEQIEHVFDLSVENWDDCFSNNANQFEYKWNIYKIGLLWLNTCNKNFDIK